MTRRSSIFDPAILRPALRSAIVKLDPRVQVRNPVMFVVWIASLACTVLALLGYAGIGGAQTQAPGTTLAIALWLWFTVYFANVAEAMAEGRGKAQAASLRKSRQPGIIAVSAV